MEFFLDSYGLFIINLVTPIGFTLIILVMMLCWDAIIHCFVGMDLRVSHLLLRCTLYVVLLQPATTSVDDVVLPNPNSCSVDTGVGFSIKFPAIHHFYEEP